MFTGIIEEVGQIASITSKKGSRRITISSRKLAPQLSRGDSIAVSGVCLTAVSITAKSFAADLAEETWQRTAFSRVNQGALVNLELPMRADGRFGGHMVQGHVDGTGQFLALDPLPDAKDYWLRIEIPPQLARYVVLKGSLSIEGISLTVAHLEGTRVSAAIIPHTAKMTNLRSLKPADPVNLEVDMIAKYVEKMMKGEPANHPLTLEKLVSEGF